MYPQSFGLPQNLQLDEKKGLQVAEGGCRSCSSPGDKSRGGKLCSLATTCLQTPLHLDCTLLPNKFSTICRNLHFSQECAATVDRALLPCCSGVELSAPSWSYIGHYCSPPRVRRQFSRREGGQGHKKLAQLQIGKCSSQWAHRGN